jgi:ABC-2 type transport system permease protein
VPLTFSLVQPLFWMLIFGFLFHRFVLGPAYAGITYLEFLLPGVCAMTVLFGASQAGVAIVRDLQTGFIQRMARASEAPAWIMAGMIGAETLRLLAQAFAVGLVGVALGARLHPDPAGLLVAAVALALFAVAYASLSSWIALRTRAQESMAAFVHVVNMPLLFTSTALVPSRQMPDWLDAVARWNPLSLVAGALRESLLFGRCADPLATLLPIAAAAGLLFLLACGAMARAAND